MSIAQHHAEWLSLLEVSGPFLSVPVLSDVFPQELDAHDSEHRARLKLAYEEWEAERSQPAIHQAWIRFVLEETLELDRVLAEGQEIPEGLRAELPIHAETLRPDLVVRKNQGKTSGAQLLIQTHGPRQSLNKPTSGSRWNASPATRMMEMLHRTGVSLGLVTNGEEWMVVWAQPGETTGFATWFANLWLEEPLTLRAFRTLLSLRRFFGVSEEETLEALCRRSASDQQQVTEQLGLQVRKAVERLIDSLDWADREQNRALLKGYDEKSLYEAALTVMMRLVFLLCAEERGLLLLGKDDLYDQYYAVSPLRQQLRETADLYGEEVMELRYDAWSRLLATFRAVHSGIAHEDLQLPAYGGSLFDPDRFPFLEGRAAATHWKDTPSEPLPINNRTVLHLLESLQLLEVKSAGKKQARETQRLSFRALDIEQIGHVYEGLLDHTAVRADAPVLGLEGGKGLEPEIPLKDLEREAELGDERLLQYLARETRRSPKALEKKLSLYDQMDQQRLMVACDNDENLVYRVRPYAGLMRTGATGYPLVYTSGGVYVTQGSDRRATGTHYTPRSLTEEIVQHALDPLVYAGMAEGVDPTPETLRAPNEILALRVCDMAMGSGAFLVQACRYLSEKLVESWEKTETEGHQQLRIPSGNGSGRELLPEKREERLAMARRLVVERCLYGVDKNPLAVEMAKLSLWLITLDEKKPFTFLDHALRCGDSLLGVTRREQLENFHLEPEGKSPQLFADAIRRALSQAEQKRQELEGFLVRDPRDGERKAQLLAGAEELVGRLRLAADLLVGVHLAGRDRSLEDRLANAAALVKDGFEKDEWEPVARAASRLLDAGNPASKVPRRPFHWALEFPEVLSGESAGFDAIVGNPGTCQDK